MKNSMTCFFDLVIEDDTSNVFLKKSRRIVAKSAWFCTHSTWIDHFRFLPIWSSFPKCLLTPHLTLLFFFFTSILIHPPFPFLPLGHSTLFLFPFLPHLPKPYLSPDLSLISPHLLQTMHPHSRLLQLLFLFLSLSLFLSQDLGPSGSLEIQIQDYKCLNPVSMELPFQPSEKFGLVGFFDVAYLPTFFTLCLFFPDLSFFHLLPNPLLGLGPLFSGSP